MKYKGAKRKGEGKKERKLGSGFHDAIVPALVVLMMWIAQKLKLRAMLWMARSQVLSDDLDLHTEWSRGMQWFGPAYVYTYGHTHTHQIKISTVGSERLPQSLPIY